MGYGSFRQAKVFEGFSKGGGNLRRIVAPGWGLLPNRQLHFVPSLGPRFLLRFSPVNNVLGNYFPC